MNRQLFQKRSLTNAQVLILFIVLCVVGAVFFAGRKAQPTKAPEEADEEGKKKEGKDIVLSAEAQKNAGLKFEEVMPQAIHGTIDVTASVQSNETRVSHVRLLSRGRIEKVNVRIGDRVEAGQVLLSYDNIELAELVSQSVAATAALQQAQTEAEVLRRAEQRARKLVELGALAQGELERRTAEAKKAEAVLASRYAEVARTDQQLRRFGVTTERDADGSRTTLKAPISGIVTETKVAIGELKGADEEVFTIADLSAMWIQADVYERDISSVRVGQTAEIKINAYPERTFSGKVTYISDVLDPTTRTAKVRCEVENLRGELRVGMFGTVSLPTSETREALMVPGSAIQTVEGKQLVFVKEGDSRLEPREVTLGTRANGRAEVKQGLKAGELVVAEGTFALKSHLLRGQIGSEEGEEKEKK
jgi:cobalt-zinc-cadmium efflux system membrane fusion protein